MLVQTEGVVLSYTVYGEHAIIVKIYTKALGLQSYIVHGVRRANANRQWSMAFFQPLQLLHMVVYHRERKNIERIKEVSASYLYARVGRDMAMAFLVGRLSRHLVSLLRADSQPDYALFAFIRNSLHALDAPLTDYVQFFLQFFVKLTGYMGVSLAEQLKAPQEHDAYYEADSSLTDRLRQLFLDSYTLPYHTKIPYSAQSMQEALQFISKYYRQHVAVSNIFSLSLDFQPF